MPSGQTAREAVRLAFGCASTHGPNAGPVVQCATDLYCCAN